MALTNDKSDDLQKSAMSFGTHDYLLALCIPTLALFSGLVVLNNPYLFSMVLTINLWCLGYHHVISTFTRISFSKKQMNENIFLLFKVPVLAFIGITLLILFVGPWTIVTIYLYWQWFHYTRQSYGISRYFESKSKVRRQSTGLNLDYASLYAIPIAGILYRSAQQPDNFLFMEVWTIPVPFYGAMAAIVVAAGIVAWQMAGWIISIIRGSANKFLIYYVLSHHVIFAFGYILVENINVGWLIINIWHNAQYIAFVHMQNQRRYKSGISKAEKLISTLSQPQNWIGYFAACLAMTTVIYVTLQFTVGYFQTFTLLPLALFVYMTINFHHYVVDAVIWRRPKTGQSAS